MNDEDEEDLIDLWFEPQTKQSIGRMHYRRLLLLKALFSTPKQFFKKLGPFLFVDLVIVVTIIIIFLLLLPSN